MYTEHCPRPIYLYIAGSSGRSLKHGVRPKFFAHLQFADDKTNATETNGRVVIPRFFFLPPSPSFTLSLFCFGFFFFLTRFPARFPPRANPITVERALKKKCGFTNRGPGILCFRSIYYIIIIIVP